MALQEIPGGVWSSAPSLATGLENTGYSLNATGKKVALVFRIEKAGTLEGVEFGTGSDILINAASTIRVAFQNVNASGQPDGTDDEYRDLLGSSLTPGGFVWEDSGIMSANGTDGGVKRVVARGDVLAIVFDYSAFTAADVFSVRELRPAVLSVAAPQAMPLPQTPYMLIHDGASWTLGGRNPMSIALRYTDGTYAYLGEGVVPTEATNSLSLNDGTAFADEAGLIFKLPVDATLRGVRVFGFQQNAGVDWQIRVYDVDNNQLGESGVLTANEWSVPPGVHNVTHARGGYRILTTDVELTRNEWYRATIRTLSGSTSSVYLALIRHQLNKIEHLDAYGGGRTFYSTQRSDGGTWTDEVTMRPMMDLHFSHFDDALGGGGGGGGGAPGRGFFRGGVS